MTPSTMSVRSLRDLLAHGVPAAALSLALGLVPACVGSPQDWAPSDRVEDVFEAFPGSDEDGPIVHPDVVVVDDEPCIVDVDVPEDRRVLVFVFEGCDPALSPIEPGRIVVGTTSGGYLRRVVSAQIEGETLVAFTEPADLAEAIVDGGFRLTVSPGIDERSMLDITNTTLYAGPLGGANVVLLLEKLILDFSSQLEVDGHWADGEVDQFDLDTSIEASGEVAVLFSSTNGLALIDNFPVWESEVSFATMVGPLPVVGTVTSELSLGFRINAPGQVKVKSGGNGSIHWGSQYRYRNPQGMGPGAEGWEDHDFMNSSWEINDPEVEVQDRGDAQVYLRVQNTVKFYGVVGPELRSDLYERIAGDPNCDELNWEVNAGLKSTAKIQMNILDKFKPNKVIASADFPLGSLSGTIEYPEGLAPSCEQPEVRCGEMVSGDTSSDEFASDLNGYSCNAGNYEAAEAIYTFTPEISGPVEWQLVSPSPMDVNHDVVVLDGTFGLVTGTCLASGPNSVSFEAEAGRTYYLVVDGYNQDTGPFSAELTCS